MSLYDEISASLFVALGHCQSPVFEQQGSEDVGPVLSFDLVRNNHLFHHLVGDARQGLLVQVQQHRTCKYTSKLSSVVYEPDGRLSGIQLTQTHSVSLFTVGDGPSEFQQTAERQRSDVRLPPAVRLLFNIFLKLDPTGRLLPLQLLVLVHCQLVQLHKDLR